MPRPKLTPGFINRHGRLGGGEVGGGGGEVAGFPNQSANRPLVFFCFSFFWVSWVGGDICSTPVYSGGGAPLGVSLSLFLVSWVGGDPLCFLVFRGLAGFRI